MTMMTMMTMMNMMTMMTMMTTMNMMTMMTMMSYTDSHTNCEAWAKEGYCTDSSSLLSSKHKEQNTNANTNTKKQTAKLGLRRDIAQIKVIVLIKNKQQNSKNNTHT